MQTLISADIFNQYIGGAQNKIYQKSPPLTCFFTQYFICIRRLLFYLSTWQELDSAVTLLYLSDLQFLWQKWDWRATVVNNSLISSLNGCVLISED